GHRKGAFTGAIANRAGSFEQAHQGTIFIDEVGDLIKELQPKLLRVLERRRFKPVGSDQLVEVDVRVVAATHKNLKDEVSRGNFREDLYYRLAVISLRIPPLRDRCDDLPRLAEHFIKLASDGKQAIEIPGSALSRFTEYPWPGNVRELRNVVERAVALTRSDDFNLESFLSELAKGLGETSIRQTEPLPFKQAKSQIVDAFEQAYLSDLIQRFGGNVSKAAREAGLDRHHLKDLLDKHGIETK
ncbi:MAG: sigma-54-dependent Fis family transcriptional regulator, partial [Deltaproteobacteria bacterium]|nr:sigma-54-dependent Fis family transcriptional regulator [Deltaproteobacteria bacterium]